MELPMFCPKVLETMSDWEVAQGQAFPTGPSRGVTCLLPRAPSQVPNKEAPRPGCVHEGTKNTWQG